ncbi:MAG: hypothetical protein R2708_21805 [Vicinamibacterales bacterium]
MAVGDTQAAKVDVVYTNSSYVSQHPGITWKAPPTARAAAWS